MYTILLLREWDIFKRPITKPLFDLTEVTTNLIDFERLEDC